MKKTLLSFLSAAAFCLMALNGNATGCIPNYPAGCGVATISIPSGGATNGWSPWQYIFGDPIPSGSYITGIDLTYTAVDQGWGGTGANSTMNVQGVNIGYGTLLHTSQTFNLTYSGTFPNYRYGMNDTLSMYFVGWSGWQANWQGGTMTIHYSNLPIVTSQCGVSLTAPTTTNTCAATITGTTATVFPDTAQGASIVNWQFASGLDTIIVGQKVIIHDTIAPVPNAASLPNVTAQCTIDSIIPPTATDNCTGTITGTTTTVFPISAHDTTIVIWTFRDGHGNTSTQSQNVIINDITPPNPPVGVLPGTVVVTIPSGGATNGWSPWQYIFADPIPSGSYITGIDLTYTAVDQGWGGTGANSTINIQGINMGYGTLLHTPQTFNLSYTGAFPNYRYGMNDTLSMYFVGWGGWQANWQGGVMTIHYSSLPVVTSQCTVASITAPTTTDNCAGTITGTTTTVFPISTQGTTVVNWKFTDNNSNSITIPQTVIIHDTIAPVPNVASLSNVTSQCTIDSVTAPTAMDNCAGTITGTTTTVFPISTQGTTVVTWTFNDGNGNTFTQSQNVIVRDTIAPASDSTSLIDVVSCVPIDSIAAPFGTDNCMGSVRGTTTTTFPISTVGTTVVTWTFSDGNGNSSTQTQNAIVENCTGIATYTESNSFNVFPNPTSGMFTIVEGNTSLIENSTITISDILGKQIYSIQPGKLQTLVDLREYTNGVYFVRISSKNSVKTIRLVLIK
ncbi:MAG: T9SS type A sorting domain-containing protein [Bacteroidia bacterium]